MMIEKMCHIKWMKRIDEVKENLEAVGSCLYSFFISIIDKLLKEKLKSISESFAVKLAKTSAVDIIFYNSP